MENTGGKQKWENFNNSLQDKMHNQVYPFTINHSFDLRQNDLDNYAMLCRISKAIPCK